jgi:hypothetical protein
LANKRKRKRSAANKKAGFARLFLLRVHLFHLCLASLLGTLRIGLMNEKDGAVKNRLASANLVAFPASLLFVRCCRDLCRRRIVGA